MWQEKRVITIMIRMSASASQVMSLHSTPVGSAADPPASQGAAAAAGRPAALDRRVSFRDGGHPVPGVLTWRPPASRSTSDLVGGVPSGGSPQVLGMLPALSAEYFQQPSPNQHPATVRSAFADAAQAPSNSNSRPQQGTHALPGLAAEVEMVEHAGETGGSDNATASQGDGLPMPDVVAEWFKTASFRNEAAAMQQPINVKDDAEGGDFAESMPLELGRNRRRHQ